MKRRLTKKLFGLLFLIIIIVSGIFFFWTDKTSAPTSNKSSQDTLQSSTKKSINTDQSSSEPNQSNPNNSSPSFNKNLYSTSDPSSQWIVVNKKHSLPSNYVPSLSPIAGGQMRPQASSALNELLTDSKNAGFSMYIISSYRSFANQTSTYNNYVAQDGTAKADTYSARPGYSEHQTGLAVDLGNGTCNLEICFGNTSAGQWLVNNSHKYGFIVRYPSDKTDITGYQYEPWHLRYVGTELSSEMNKTNITTLEEFFSIPGGPNY